jgi:hypothetical protein
MGLFGTERGNSPSPTLPLVENLVRGKYRYAKNQEKKRKLSQERLLSEKTPRFLL